MELGSGIYVFGVDILYIFTYSMFAIYFSIAYQYSKKQKSRTVSTQNINFNNSSMDYEEIIDVEVIGDK